MSARPLKSDQVNYLIWRYLQESGHAQTAARLQRDWGRGDPEKLPFAPHIRTHALVHLLQKGLRYHELETSLDQNGAQRPPAFFFGPELGATASPTPARLDDDGASDTSRKHARELQPNGAPEATLQPPSAKRSRRGNAAGAVNGARGKAGDGMDVDASDATPKREPGTAASTRTASPAPPAPAATDVEMDLDPAAPESVPVRDRSAPTTASPGHVVHAEDAPVEALPVIASPVIVPTLEQGSSIGVQSDKVADLGPETAILQVGGTNVTHARWSPRDPTLLAAAGDALCRLWTIPTGAGARADPNAEHQHHHAHHPILTPSKTVELHNADDGYYVTSLAWSPDGGTIAVAKHPTTPGAAGLISIYDKTGSPVAELPGGQELLLNLLWNPAGTLLLGISHTGDASTVMAWDVDAGRELEPLRVPHTLADAAWTDARFFLVCARGLVASSSVGARIEPLSARPDVGSQDWSRIAHDTHTATTVVAADGAPGVLGSVGPDGRWLDAVAHPHAEITALIFQPLANTAAVRTDPGARRLYATAATDGAVKVWDARRPFACVHTLELGRGDPALALSFTPDGYLVAAASADKILFWNADAGGPPKAAWHGARLVNGTAHVNGNGHTNGDVAMADGGEEAEAIPSLSWDADGGKLAYGAKSQIAIISFRR